MKLSGNQQDIVRTLPHRTKLHVSIYRPQTVMTCRINDATIHKGARIITYDNAMPDLYSAVQSGQSLLIGSSEGASDIGKIRIRSASSTQFIVSENSNIDWQNGLYLTVLKLWELWPIYQSNIVDPGNVENVLFYKDFDIEYTNQNTILGTFVNAGPHRAGELQNGSKDFYYSATGTYNVAGAGLSYFWDFEGGTPATSNAETPGLVNYSVAGNYVTTLLVSGTNGGSDIIHKYVAIHPENGSLAKTEIMNINISPGQGGAIATIKIHNPLFTIYDGVPVVIFKEDWYGDEKISISGNSPNTGDIFMSGYILKDTIKWDYANGSVEFQIGSITQLMKNSISYVVSVESKSTPTTWNELQDMDVRKAIYHYLKWHTTVLSTTDFQFIGQDYPMKYFDSDRESIFDAINNLMMGALIGHISSDMQGKIWAEIDARATPNPSIVYPINAIEKQDWVGEINLDEVQDSTSYLELGGASYISGTSSALLSCAPGDAPNFEGMLDIRKGLILGSQAQLNTMVGMLYSNLNTNYKNLDMTMKGNYSFMDTAPQNLYHITINPEDTPKKISLTGYYIPQSIQWTYNAKSQFLRPVITFEKVVTSTVNGQTIIIPPIPPDGGGGGGGHRPPPIIPPIFPDSSQQILKIVGDKETYAPGTSQVFVFDTINISSAFAGDYFRWPSIIQPVRPNGYIDILQSGIYRVSAAIFHELICFDGCYGSTPTFSWKIFNFPFGAYPGEFSYPYKEDNIPTSIMEDVFYFQAGDTIGINVNSLYTSFDSHIYIALTIARLGL